ncbi:MAG: hypothetical protein KGL39_58325 [Patescibacteria group bacterium]|nr:hypothetical protein [Patescibacteria group bacterium]
MPASLVPNGKQQFTDINGAPLVGGFVHMYEPNTLVPSNTWQDSTQLVLNTNPIVLDSRGQCIIYGVGSYRQILTDSLGNTIWDTEITAFQESVFGPQDSLASATTTDLGSVTSNNVLITGTTTINSFGTSASLANPIYIIQFAGILQLTYNATSMILPGGANITTAAGDSAMVEFINTLGYWRMIAYWSQAASGALGTAAAKNTGTSGANVPLLNGANVWSGVTRFTVGTSGDEVALVVAANASTPDFATGNNFTVSISANYTLNNPANVPANGGQSGIIAVTQTAGSLTISWGTSYKAAGGISAVNLSGVNGATDYFAYYAHSSTSIVITPILHPT